MTTVKGTLPIGIEYGGKVHREFKLRPRLVRDSVEAAEEVGDGSESRTGLAILARQFVQLGNIPPTGITTEVLLDMYEEDLGELYRAAEEVAAKLKTFRGSRQEPAAAGTGTS